MTQLKNKVLSKEIPKKKDVWKISGLVGRIQSLILEGMLKRQNGATLIYDKIKEEFRDTLSEQAYNLDKRKFVRKLPEFIWSVQVVRDIKRAIRNRLDPEIIYPAVSYLPHAMFLRKWNELKGKSASQRTAEFVRGILRLSNEISTMNGDPYDFKTGTFKHPNEIPLRRNGRPPQIFYLNGVNLGVPYSSVFEENPALQALQNAEWREDDVVVITNFLDMETQKAGGSPRVYRALFSGRHVNPQVMDPRYVAEVERIRKDKPHEEMVYEILAETFLNSMKGWAKILGTRREPTFNGPIRIVLGYREEAIIMAAAYWEAAYFTRRKQNQLQIQMSLTRQRIAAELKRNRDADVSEFEEFLHDVEDQLARTTVTNITAEDLKRYYYKVLRFVIRTIEATFPNSKVIGIGTTHIRVGGKLIEIYIPRNEKPSDEILAEYCRSYGPRVLRERMADAVVICHPFAVNHRFTVREVDKNGERGSVPIFVAPTLVDEKFIRDILRDTVRKAHPISRAMLNEQFNAGVLRLVSVNGVFSPEPWRADALQAFAKSCLKKRKLGEVGPEGKYIWIAFFTDPHFGSATREILTAPDGRLFGVTEAVMDMMRQAKLFERNALPVHMFSMNDDPTQGNHFGTHQQPHPKKMSYLDIERRLQAMLERARQTESPDEIRRILSETARFSRLQFWYRGEHWPHDQVEEVIDRLVRPNVDFFDAVLRRADKSGLIVKGLSAFNGADQDKRDIGIINIGTGNHFLHSVENQLTEGTIYAACLRERLLAIPRWRKAEEEIRRMVKAPLYSNQFIAWGTIQAPGGFEWGIDFRDTPTGGIDWSDTLLGVVRNDLHRGNYNRIMEGKVTLKNYGDKHFFGLVLTPWAVYHMSAADCHTDLYGERGFPPNNTGMSFIGLPANGPKSGPVLCRFLPFDHIRRFFEKGELFDWESFLPNPL
jgi:hypothetical protein